MALRAEYQRLLDDLEEGQSRILVGLGDTKVKGIYEGLVRRSDGGPVEWHLIVGMNHRRDATGEFIEADSVSIEVSEIEFIKLRS